VRAQDSVRGQDIVRFNGKKDARHYISVSGIFFYENGGHSE